MSQIRFTILGCGSSGGVPRIGGLWGNCDPDEPKNTRQRCSVLVERIGENGTTTLLIDTSPDMRRQLLDAKVGQLDAVVFTHQHADHLHGLDDLRMIVINMRKKMQVYAAGSAMRDIRQRFSYAFDTPAGSSYPPILEMNPLTEELVITGAGGDIRIETFNVPHGGLDVRAIRINDVLYTPDISDLPQNPESNLTGLKYWILDSLRYSYHPSHINVETALAWIETYAPKQAILTNLHIDLDYQKLNTETPDHVQPAYDGMQFSLDI